MGPIDKSVVGGPIAYPSQPKGIPKTLEDNLVPMGPSGQGILKVLYTWATTKLTYTNQATAGKPKYRNTTPSLMGYM